MISPYYIEIGNRIKKRRLLLKISKSMLSKYLGITIPMLDDIENGLIKIDTTTICKISFILNINANYLITGINEDFIKVELENLNKYIDAFKLVSSLSSKQKKTLSNLINYIKHS